MTNEVLVSFGEVYKILTEGTRPASRSVLRSDFARWRRSSAGSPDDGKPGCSTNWLSTSEQRLRALESAIPGAPRQVLIQQLEAMQADSLIVVGHHASRRNVHRGYALSVLGDEVVSYPAGQ